MNTTLFKAYCCAIIFIVAMPLSVTLINLVCDKPVLAERELNGVVVAPAQPSFSLSSFLAGELQSDCEDYFEYNLFSRRTQTRIYNQILYSVFNSTDNRDILVGKDGYLFEKSYATSYLTELEPSRIKELKDNIKKLEELTHLLENRGIPLLVRVSPSKAAHYPEYLPSSYSRFVEMKQEEPYTSNWYQSFCEEISKTDIPVYDRYDLMQQMKNNGDVVFTKGGTHWSLAPMEEYINGLNSLMEQLLNRKLGRMVADSSDIVMGDMGCPDDDDIWKLCWNVISAPPNYPSPHISYTTIAEGEPLDVFTVGQSFTTVLLRAIYSAEPPLWNETNFSWYNARVIQYPSNVPWGTTISEETNEFERYLGADIIQVEFLENGDGLTQFQFVDNMLQYLLKEEAAN